MTYPQIRVDDPFPTTVEECQQQQAALEEERCIIKGRVDKALASNTADPVWVARCRSAMRHKKARMRALAVHKARLMSQSQAAFDAAFKESVIRLFDPEDVRLVYEDVYANNPEFEGRL